LKNNISKVLKFLLLPILIAVYFPLLNYANNAEIINLGSLFPLLGVSFLLAIGSYFLIGFFAKKQSHKISLAAFILLVFFNTYGIFFKLLNLQDSIEIRHLYFLPLFLLIGIFTIFQLFKIEEEIAHNIWRILSIISIFLVVLNVIRIIPIEIRKLSRKNKLYNPITIEENLKPDRPDIYYIIFDEFAGFEAMRDYWQSPDVDDFVLFLHRRGFFVAENSHSTNNSIGTLHQMAIRLNYKHFPANSDKEDYYEAITDNQVMKTIQEKGYQTITFDEISGQFGYPARGPIQADINYEDDPRIETYEKNIVFDAFGKLVTENSILSAISNFENIAYAGLEQLLLHQQRQLKNLILLNEPARH